MISASYLYRRAKEALCISPHARLVLTIKSTSEPGTYIKWGAYGFRGRVGATSTDGTARVLIAAALIVEMIEAHELVYTSTDMTATETMRQAA